MAYKNLEIEIEQLLRKAVERQASDVHIIPGQPPVLRIFSDLTPLADEGHFNIEQTHAIAKLLMGDDRYQTFLKERDVDFSFEFDEASRFRVNAYFQRDRVALAIRVISNTIKTPEELNLPPVISDFTSHKQGLVLIVGPTGHGKTTTMASLIDDINQNREEHIITIEDPIEYIFNSKKSIIQQREVGGDTLSFSRAIRATLREDANVVVVGEMRDHDSIASTMTVAETGHLVIATLHTNDAAQTIDRIIDSFPPHQQQQIRIQLASVLIGIISMRLVDKVGGGRIPAVEVMFNNHAVRNLIRKDKTYELINVIHTGSSKGMVSMDQYLAELVSAGSITLEEAKSYIRYPEIFRSQLKQ